MDMMCRLSSRQKGKTMSRYIDADALKDAHIECPDHISFFDFGEMVELFLQTIDLQPTVDAAPVRCKECKHCYAEGFVNVRNVCEKHYDFGNVDDDWFCADGERRSDGNTAENE